MLFRGAILAKQQIVCTYQGRNRELCPHVLGLNKDGEKAVLAWQFAGQSGGPLPEWRCLRLAEVGKPAKAAGIPVARIECANAALSMLMST